jgi:hypothetical protein
MRGEDPDRIQSVDTYDRTDSANGDSGGNEDSGEETIRRKR